MNSTTIMANCRTSLEPKSMGFPSRILETASSKSSGWTRAMKWHTWSNR